MIKRNSVTYVKYDHDLDFNFDLSVFSFFHSSSSFTLFLDHNLLSVQNYTNNFKFSVTCKQCLVFKIKIRHDIDPFMLIMFGIN